MALAWWCGVAVPASVAVPPLELLRSEQQLFHSVIDTARPFVVRIDTVGGTQPGSPPPRSSDQDDGTPDRRGAPQPPPPVSDTLGSRFPLADGPTTGIVYQSDGLILTSSFNFVRQPALITVTLADGRQFVADLVGRDQVRKLALLKIDAVDLPVARWVSETDVHVGQWAIALGFGYGGREAGVTVGIVSARDRMRGYALQTDANLSPANYGGPLLDRQGRILGICVPMAQRPGELAGIEFYDSGVGFALPHWRVEDIVGELKRGRNFYRGWLGVAFAPTSDGLVIRAFSEGSPLHAAGARAGDGVIQINGTPVSNMRQVFRELYLLAAGEEVDLRLRREGDDIDVRVALVRSDELGPLLPQENQIDQTPPHRDRSQPP